MRVFVISDLPQFVTGGAEMQAYRLVRAWKRAGHEVIVAGRRMQPGTLPLDDGSRLRVLKIRTLQRFGRALRALTYAVSLAWLLLRHRRHFDIVYARFLNEGAAVVALLKRLHLLHQPLVAVPANVRGVGDVHALRQLPGSRRIIDLLAKECDTINLIAGAMVEELTTAGFDPGQFSRIPNGIPLSDVAPRYPSSPPTFLTVGRLAPQKGLDVLIRALGQLSEQLRPGQFRIAGDGPERDRLHAMAGAVGVEHAITWLGELAPEAVARELDDADVFLLPSRYEGMSNAGLEAMERGKAMLITRCGGLDEFITPAGGWLADPGDESTLVDALSQALHADTTRLAGMGKANRVMVEQHFAMNIVSARYMALFEQLRDNLQGPDDAAR